MSLILLFRTRPVRRTFPPLTAAAKHSIIIRTPGENIRLERSVVDEYTAVLGGAHTTRWRTPADASGLRACRINGGYPRRGPHSYEYLYLRDKQIMDRGFIADVDPDHAAGWVEFTGTSNLAHLQHMTVGDQLPNLLPDGGIGTGFGWTNVNAVESPGGSVAGGVGVTLKAGPDHTSPFASLHCNIDTGTSDLDRTYYFSVWANWNGGGLAAYPPQVLLARYDPNKHATDPTRITNLTKLSTPSPMPKNKWFKVEGTVEIAHGAVDDQVRVGLWAPRGGGSVQYCGARCVVDPGLTVPPGATSADMVAALINHGAALQGLRLRAVVVAPSTHVFPDDGTGVGFRYPYIDHANIWSSVQSYASEVDILYDPAGDVVYVGGTDTFGTRHTDLVLTNTGPRAGVVKSQAPSDKMITDEFVQEPNGGASREEVLVTRGDAVTPWRDVYQAPDGTYPDGLAPFGDARISMLGDPSKMTDTGMFPPPPDGTSPSSWLNMTPTHAGKRPGDWVPVRTSGAYETSTFKRIGSLTSQPSQGDTLTMEGVG